MLLETAAGVRINPARVWLPRVPRLAAYDEGSWQTIARRIRWAHRILNCLFGVDLGFGTIRPFESGHEDGWEGAGSLARADASILVPIYDDLAKPAQLVRACLTLEILGYPYFRVRVQRG